MGKDASERPNWLWAKRFKEARIAAGLSQKQLGVEVGLDEFVASTRINRYELGVHRADFPMEVRLAKSLDVPVAFFYAHTGELAELLAAFHRATKPARKMAIEALTGSTAS